MTAVSWLVIIGVLTLGNLRLPSAFTLNHEPAVSRSSDMPQGVIAHLVQGEH